MRSPRSRFESACRVGAFAALGWLLGTTVIPSPEHLERASAADLPSRLDAWTLAAPTAVLHGEFATTPESWVVDWLAALAHSGHPVSWSGAPPAIAMSVEALPDPKGGTRIDVAAPSGSQIVLRDDASVIDSVRVSRFGASLVAPIVMGSIAGSTLGQRFGGAAPAPPGVRAIAVVGEAGWEGKFIISALEERGWPVIARFSVAPNVDVVQGASFLLDTSRIAAVVAVDTSVERLGEALRRFVRSGGGLVLAGRSSSAASVATLAPGVLGARVRAAVQSRDTLSLGSTGFYPVAVLNRDGVALELRSGGVAVAARRVGAGRVVQVGYDDSWRWRMAGATGSEAAHREWWSRVVASVAYVPDGRVTTAGIHDQSAPLARLVDRLGPPRALAVGRHDGFSIDPRILMTLIIICLLAEWSSRRLRGLP